MTRSANPRCFLTPDETRQVEETIAWAERRTSAEIKLVIARHCWGDILEKARTTFCRDGLDRTKEQNAVLILLVTTNREFLIYGGEGIHCKVGSDYWLDVRDVMTEKFRSGNMGEGICDGVQLIGRKLAEYFPVQADDENELSDEVAYED